MAIEAFLIRNKYLLDRWELMKVKGNYFVSRKSGVDNKLTVVRVIRCFHISKVCMLKMLIIIPSNVKYITVELGIGEGHVWVFREFSFAEASFHPSWSCAGFWLANQCLALPSALLVSVWDLAVSLSAYSILFSWNLKGREEGWGLLVLAFFLQTTQRMQLSWPQVCLSFWQVIKMQYCSDLLLLECIVKRLDCD